MGRLSACADTPARAAYCPSGNTASLLLCLLLLKIYKLRIRENNDYR